MLGNVQVNASTSPPPIRPPADPQAARNLPSQVDPGSVDIDTPEKAQEFIKSALAGAKEKMGELKKIIEADALLNGLNGIDHKNAGLMSSSQTSRAMH